MNPSRADALAALRALHDRLHADPGVASRIDAAGEFGALFSSGALDGHERDSVHSILEALVGDVEQEVRHALAEQVKSCSFLPRALALRIAKDVDAIAAPFVRASPALGEAELLSLVRGGSSIRQTAIAARATVSEAVSAALAESGDREVVATLLRNQGAAIAEPALQRILGDFGADEDVQGLMTERPFLPLGVIQRLIQVVSEVLRDRLIERHALPADLAVELVGLAGERTLVEDARAAPEAYDPAALAGRLHRGARLTPTLLMRALFIGDLRFFEAGMACLAGIDVVNARALVADAGRQGFKSLYDQAGLPGEFFRAFRGALDVRREAGLLDRQGFEATTARAILERVMRDYDEACPADLEQLLSQMSHGILGRLMRPRRR
jgi:uncharacterized protein (DUF2336 family)